MLTGFSPKGLLHVFSRVVFRNSACQLLLAVGVMTICWHFRCAGQSAVSRWHATDELPDIRQLASVRSPRSSPLSRHIPVRAWCTTTGSQLGLESGLEHDLVRKLDRLPDVVWMVAQPATITWTDDDGDRAHTPDLLSLDALGDVTIWDARPRKKQDAEFLRSAEITRQACSDLGWGYEVFSELGTTERLNHLWLHGFRRRPSWLPEARPQIDDVFRDNEYVSLGELFAADGGDGRLVAAVWHLTWTGDLRIDLTRKIGQLTQVTIDAKGGH